MLRVDMPPAKTRAKAPANASKTQCVPIADGKWAGGAKRGAPPYHAKPCAGRVMTGLDGCEYTSKPSGASYRWRADLRCVQAAQREARAKSKKPKPGPSKPKPSSKPRPSKAGHAATGGHAASGGCKAVCASGKVCNPHTKRCVNRDGAAARRHGLHILGSPRPSSGRRPSTKPAATTRAAATRVGTPYTLTEVIKNLNPDRRQNRLTLADAMDIAVEAQHVRSPDPDNMHRFVAHERILGLLGPDAVLLTEELMLTLLQNKKSVTVVACAPYFIGRIGGYHVLKITRNNIESVLYNLYPADYSGSSQIDFYTWIHKGAKPKPAAAAKPSTKPATKRGSGGCKAVCASGKVCNPASGRCVNRDGAVAKKLRLV